MFLFASISSFAAFSNPITVFSYLVDFWSLLELLADLFIALIFKMLPYLLTDAVFWILVFWLFVMDLLCDENLLLERALLIECCEGSLRSFYLTYFFSPGIYIYYYSKTVFYLDILLLPPTIFMVRCSLIGGVDDYYFLNSSMLAVLASSSILETVKLFFCFKVWDIRCMLWTWELVPPAVVESFAMSGCVSSLEPLYHLEK